jgi:hypothetical protein
MSDHARRLAGALCLASAIAWTLSAGAAGTSGGGADARCRRVKLDGTITVTPKPRADFKGVILASEGTFTMDLIFPEKGGDVLYQQNTVSLTRLKSYAYGGARQCRNTLPASATTPRPFTVWAQVAVGAIVAEDANNKVRSVSDQFDLMVKTLPTSPAISYTAICDGGQPGTASDYGTSIAQLVQVFSRTQYSGSLTLNRIGDRRQLPNVDLFGSLTGAAEWETLETLVPCGNFQYK